jgi:hypothetical protein
VCSMVLVLMQEQLLNCSSNHITDTGRVRMVVLRGCHDFLKSNQLAMWVTFKIPIIKQMLPGSFSCTPSQYV